MNYDDMSTSELRKLVRDKGLATGLVVAGARKADLDEGPEARNGSGSMKMEEVEK